MIKKDIHKKDLINGIYFTLLWLAISLISVPLVGYIVANIIGLITFTSYVTIFDSLSYVYGYIILSSVLLYRHEFVETSTNIFSTIIILLVSLILGWIFSNLYGIWILTYIPIFSSQPIMVGYIFLLSAYLYVSHIVKAFK